MQLWIRSIILIRYFRNIIMGLWRWKARLLLSSSRIRSWKGRTLPPLILISLSVSTSLKGGKKSLRLNSNSVFNNVPKRRKKPKNNSFKLLLELGKNMMPPKLIMSNSMMTKTCILVFISKEGQAPMIQQIKIFLILFLEKNDIY